jgi:hypothetical protein
MASFNFPVNPDPGDIFTLPDGNDVEWNGYAWVPVSSDITYPLPINKGGTEAVTAPQALINLGAIGEAPNDTFLYGRQDLGWAKITGTGGTVTSIGIDSPLDSGLTVTSTTTNPITNTGIFTLTLDPSLTDIADIVAGGGSGIIISDGNGGITSVTIDGTDGNIVVTNGDGSDGNPTVDLAPVTDLATGTFVKITRDAYGRISGTTPVLTTDISGLIDGSFVKIAGDTMTGPLVLPLDPALPLEAATKQYVDTGLATKIGDALSNDIIYGRLNATWTPLGGATGAFVMKSGDVMTGPLTLARDPALPLEASTMRYTDTKLSDAPVDTFLYGRQDGAWTQITGTGGTVTSVAVTSPVDGGLVVTGSPIINAGTIVLTLDPALTDIVDTITGGVPGIIIGDGAGGVTSVTITGQAGNIVVTNGDGVAGNPLINLDTAGTPVTNALVKLTTDTFGRVTATTPVTSADLAPIITDDFVLKLGDTMEGILVLFADPVAPMDAATKQYVDTLVGTGSGWVESGTAPNIISTLPAGIDGTSTAIIQADGIGEPSLELWQGINRRWKIANNQQWFELTGYNDLGEARPQFNINRTTNFWQINSGNIVMSPPPGGAGGTFTISSDPTSDPTVILSKSPGRSSRVNGTTGSFNRWSLVLGDATAEAADAGSDFALERYNDLGVLVDAPLIFLRGTGLGTVIADPVDPLGIATKQYVDTIAAAGNVTTFSDDAPILPSKVGDRWVKTTNMTELVWAPNAGSDGVWINPAEAAMNAVGITYPISIDRGGTGAITAAAALINLGAIGEAPIDTKQYARQGGAWAEITSGGGGDFLPLTGGQLSGDLRIQTEDGGGSLRATGDLWSERGFLSIGISTTLDSKINLYKAPGGIAHIRSMTTGLGELRWEVILGDAEPETGGNSGSNFAINNFADNTGSIIGTPLSISRATSVVNFAVQPTVAGVPIVLESSLTSAVDQLTIKNDNLQLLIDQLTSSLHSALARIAALEAK